jgi:putative ABC transport system substrate-binding protein
MTGFSFLLNELTGKRLEVLRELAPKAASIGFLFNPMRPSAEAESKNVREAAQKLGLQLQILNASNEHEVDAAFAEFEQHKLNALMVGADSLFLGRRDRIVQLAAQHAIPAIYNAREFVATGGLASYAPSFAEVYRQAGIYTAKILGGAKPAELPVIQPTKYELVINLKTAKVLGLTVPLLMQMTADEVIE